MSEKYPVPIDHTAFDEYRLAYDWADPFASSESFPGLDETVDTQPFVLLPIPNAMSIDEAVAWLKDQWNRSASARELAAFGKTYPDLVKQGRIVAPGAVTARPYVRRALALDVGKDGKRLLTFAYAAVPLPAGTRLLAVLA